MRSIRSSFALMRGEDLREFRSDHEWPPTRGGGRDRRNGGSSVAGIGAAVERPWQTEVPGDCQLPQSRQLKSAQTAGDSGSANSTQPATLQATRYGTIDRPSPKKSLWGTTFLQDRNRVLTWLGTKD